MTSVFKDILEDYVNNVIFLTKEIMEAILNPLHKNVLDVKSKLIIYFKILKF